MYRLRCRLFLCPEGHFPRESDDPPPLLYDHPIGVVALLGLNLNEQKRGMRSCNPSRQPPPISYRHAAGAVRVLSPLSICVCVCCVSRDLVRPFCVCWYFRFAYVLVRRSLLAAFFLLYYACTSFRTSFACTLRFGMHLCAVWCAGAHEADDDDDVSIPKRVKVLSVCCPHGEYMCCSAIPHRFHVHHAALG